MNIGVHISFGIMVFSGIFPGMRLLGQKMVLFLGFFFFEELNTVLYSGCANLHYHQKGRRVPFLPYPLQHLVFIEFFMMAILTSVK